MSLYKDLVKKVSISPEKKVKQKEYISQGCLPIVDQGKNLVGGYSNDTSKELSCKLPVIVFGDHTRAVKYVDFPFGPGADGIKVLEPKSGILPKYLYYATQYLVLRLEDKGYARHYQHIEKKEINVPEIGEQKRIVAKIEEMLSQLDDGVETLNKTKEQLKVYRQAILKDAFEGKFTKLKHEKISIDIEGCTKEETKNLPEIPSDWKYVHLNKLGDLGRGKSKHRPRNDARLFEDGKYPFLQTSEVKNADKYITEYSKMYGEFGLAQSKLWPKGTLCITIAANIAETAFLGIDACFPDSVVGFTPNKNTNPFYIKYFIESQKLRLWAFAPATAQKNINLDTLENLVVPYCGREEQDKVVKEIESRMSVCDGIERTIDLSLQQAEALRQSILKKVFEGEF